VKEKRLFSLPVENGVVAVFLAGYVALFNEVFQPIADRSANWVVFVLELDHEVGDGVTAVYHRLLKNFIW
jgi:hypothetical protein